MAVVSPSIVRAQNAPTKPDVFVPPAWVVPDLPKPNSDGWITLFDGEQLHGSNPTNRQFATGKVFIHDHQIWLDSVGIHFNQLKSREASLRVQVRKSSESFSLWFGPYIGRFSGHRDFGITRGENQHYTLLKDGQSSANFDDFFELEFLVVGGKLVLMADGKPVIVVREAENTKDYDMGLYPLKGTSVIKRIEVRLSDVQSLLPKDETPGNTSPKPDAAERLRKVKALYDQGLINKDDYDKKVKEIMDSL